MVWAGLISHRNSMHSHRAASLSEADPLTLFPFPSSKVLEGRVSNERIFLIAVLFGPLVFAGLLFGHTERSAISAQSAPLMAADFTCNVASITDGDTLRCSDGTRVRRHAIAARERDNR